jgi:hypothetical protein
MIPAISLDWCSPIKRIATVSGRGSAAARPHSSRIWDYYALSRHSSTFDSSITFSFRHSHPQYEDRSSIKTAGATQSILTSPSSLNSFISDLPTLPTLIKISKFYFRMKNLFNLAACLALAQASPLRIPLEMRFPSVDVTFNGAAGASYTVLVPLDGIYTPTSEF